MKILYIGNSYSEDATRYLHQIAEANGENIKVASLFIGSCTFTTHFHNMNNDAAAYTLIFNGHSTGFKVSIKQALQADEWDYVVMHQQSSRSAHADTFEPYFSALSEYVSFHCPKAKKALMQTWFYVDEEATQKRANIESPEKMFEMVKDAYKAISESSGIKTVIPAGQALWNLRQNGGNTHRDAIHASYGVGRYTLALTVYETLMKKVPEKDITLGFDVPVSDEELAMARKSAHDAVTNC